MKLNTYAKALIAALVAGLGALQIASADGVISSAEWIQIASVTVAALGFVWGVPNASTPEPVGSYARGVNGTASPGSTPPAAS